MSLLSLSRKPARRTLIAGAIATAILGGSALTAVNTLIPANQAVAQVALNKAPREGFADLVERLMPTVVSVEVGFTPVADERGGKDFEHRERRFGRGGEGFDRGSPFDFFERFDRFRNFPGNSPRRERRRRGRAVGSGFIVSADGFVVTNHHVVRGASEVTVKLNDGTKLKAKVVGRDPKTDLAVLKINAKRKFQFAKLAAKDPRVGDWVIAVGNPFGLGGTVTTGIVSARGRNIGNGPYDNFLQIDASINKGNSGGPAFNLAGEVIGVNTAIFSPSGGNVGIGFAIPASITRTVINDLINNGVVTRGWLGVQIQPINADIAQSIGLDKPGGTLVARVTPNSPAAKGGLKTGDAVLSVNGQIVKDPRELARVIAAVKPGETAELGIFRKGKHTTVDITIGKMPGREKMASLEKQQPAPDAPKRFKLGVAVEQARDGSGLVVRDLDPRGIAAKHGLRRGDIILQVAGKDVTTTRELSDALAEAAKSDRDSILVLVRSQGRQRFLAMPLNRS